MKKRSLTCSIRIELGIFAIPESLPKNKGFLEGGEYVFHTLPHRSNLKILKVFKNLKNIDSPRERRGGYHPERM
jgi:hypothetical protein